MTQLSKERLEEIAEDGFLKHGEGKSMARRLLAAEAHRLPVPDDTKRLDWLDAQNKRLNEYYGTSYGWKFDANFQRNAMMLNDSNYPVMNVRQALDEAMKAAPQVAQPVQVPDGWKLVPAEATEKMLVSGLEEADPLGALIDWDASRGDCNTRQQVQDIFKAMLAAAPQPESD